MRETPAKDGYEDFLSNMSLLGGELSWITQRRNFSRRTICESCFQRRSSPGAVRDVLNSKRIKEEVELQAKSRGISKDLVEDEVKQILFTMAHQMDLFSIRVVGYAVVKVFKMLFDAIFVNTNHITRLKKIFEDNPVVFIPTHRSYLDFLLLSVICFDQEIPLPAIASAMDFMNSKMIGETLRRCGAFFIKRQIGKDRLYWSVFSEYIQSHIINADYPLEFFIDGTRSRSNKSLYPKFGLLQVLLEPFFRRQVYDMVIIPVTISYDKIVEECLFACELLGFGKPKESASGLFKARRVFNERYGRVFVTFGDPISLKHYFSAIERLPFTFLSTDDGKTGVQKFGHFVVQSHFSMDIICVWPYISFLLLQTFEKKRRLQQTAEIAVKDLYRLLENFLALAEDLGMRVMLVGGLREDFLFSIKLHSKLFRDIAANLSPDSVLRPAVYPVGSAEIIPSSLAAEAVTYVSLWCYSNQLMHNFADISIICTVLRWSKKRLSLRKSRYFFCALRDMFDHEFVFLSTSRALDDLYSSALNLLLNQNIISIEGETLRSVKFDKIVFLSSFIEPYLCSYYFFLETAACFAGSMVTEDALIKGTQSKIATALTTHIHEGVQIQCLSIDPLRNSLLSFVAKRALVKEVGHGYFVDDMRLNHFTEIIRAVTLWGQQESDCLYSKL